MGAAEDPAQEGELYPHLEWMSIIDSFMREGSSFQIKGREKLTVRTASGVRFQPDRVEVVGRLEDGQAVVELSAEDLTVEEARESKAMALLDAVDQLVETAAKGALHAAHTHLSLLSFQLLGQGFALFQAAKTVLQAHQPVEALQLLRGLVVVAARFEQIADPNGHGLGTVVRLVLDEIDNLDASADIVEPRRVGLIAAATSSGLTVPDALAEPQATRIYSSLGTEMRIAGGAEGATFTAGGLHMTQVEPDSVAFQTKLEEGPLADMVSSACVIAMLELLKSASQVLSWTTDAEKTEAILMAARALNETAAERHLSPQGAADEPLGRTTPGHTNVMLAGSVPPLPPPHQTG